MLNPQIFFHAIAILLTTLRLVVFAKNVLLIKLKRIERYRRLQQRYQMDDKSEFLHTALTLPREFIPLGCVIL